MELGGVPQKLMKIFHWGPIFYVCSSARNWVSSISGYISYMKFPLGSSNPGCLKVLNYTDLKVDGSTQKPKCPQDGTAR